MAKAPSHFIDKKDADREQRLLKIVNINWLKKGTELQRRIYSSVLASVLLVFYKEACDFI